mgnify:CR=1 FL=1
MRRLTPFLFVLLLLLTDANARHALVIQTDFGTKDGAVAEMKGISMGVDPDLRLFDLSHENTPYDIWEAAYRLKQTAPYWPQGTVFVSVIDPGVGTERKSVVLKTKSGHYFVTPDNGTLTLVADELGIDEIREIDETRNRREDSARSYTFHGRDVYAFTGARLASGKITFEEVGPALPPEVVILRYEKASGDASVVRGSVPVLDFRYGNVWTNIPSALFSALAPKPEFGDRFLIVITHDGSEVWRGTMPYARTFGDVPEGEPLLYLNSLLNVAFALNMGDFAATHGISSGSGWAVQITRASEKQ